MAAIDKMGVKTPTKKKSNKVLLSADEVTKVSKNFKQNIKGTIPENKVMEKVQAKATQKNQGDTIFFHIVFHTDYGQNLFITGNHEIFGNGDVNKAIPMHYLDDGIWTAELLIDETHYEEKEVSYYYLLRNADGSFIYDADNDRKINIQALKNKSVLVLDAWNHAGYYENAFYTEAFRNVLLKNKFTTVEAVKPAEVTHIFRIKTPMLAQGETVCLLGSNKQLTNWNSAEPILMSRSANSESYEAYLDLTKTSVPFAYKYGIYNVEQKKFVRYENGNNRMLFDGASETKLTIINDGFLQVPVQHWKGAGVAIPVFSLKSKQSWGIGEFNDIKLLADWGNQVGLKLIQILPINDTTANHSWTDSYPYAAISAFALNPIFLHIPSLTTDNSLISEFEEERIRLNNLHQVDYEAVSKLKWDVINKLYPILKKEVFASKDYKEYYNKNKHWLLPYALFCYLRDLYGTANYYNWPENNSFAETDVAKLTDIKAENYDAVAIHYFVQYQLHLQLKLATDYAHSKELVFKGDIAIGIYRYGADAWQSPELYYMNAQAGAPPDDFAIKGQNWGFPTYNWARMKEDGFAWWRQRFEQMSYYFDAFRIDHILGFFRIWTIPLNAVEGIMGHFVPAIPIRITELNQKGIHFDYLRYTRPFINDAVLWDRFGDDSTYVKNNYLDAAGYGNYTLKPEFDTQVKVENYFENIEANDFNNRMKLGLYDLISNVIFFEEEGTGATAFHFRFNMEGTLSFKYLDISVKEKLKELYVNYFFRRQDDFWMKEAMNKLPALRRVTNMLICGEDLGLVPACVPDLMKQLGLLSLEIQRMPKDNSKEFFHPNDAPYLSVVTPSTHDMSTIRGWWEEDKTKMQKFYNHDLGKQGGAPYFCEAWINRLIVVQHLYSPAMWSIFQLQDLMGIDEHLRVENPNDERINVPADPKHYWRYRMHIGLEQLIKETNFNTDLKGLLASSGRG